MLPRLRGSLGRIFDFYLKLPEIELAKLILQVVTTALLDEHEGVRLRRVVSINLPSLRDIFPETRMQC